MLLQLHRTITSSSTRFHYHHHHKHLRTVPNISRQISLRFSSLRSMNNSSPKPSTHNSSISYDPDVIVSILSFFLKKKKNGFFFSFFFFTIQLNLQEIDNESLVYRIVVHCNFEFGFFVSYMFNYQLAISQNKFILVLLICCFSLFE